MTGQELTAIEEWMARIEDHRNGKKGGVIGQAFDHIRRLIAHIRAAPAGLAGVTYVPLELLNKAEKERGEAITLAVDMQKARIEWEGVAVKAQALSAEAATRISHLEAELHVARQR